MDGPGPLSLEPGSSTDSPVAAGPCPGSDAISLAMMTLPLPTNSPSAKAAWRASEHPRSRTAGRPPSWLPLPLPMRLRREVRGGAAVGSEEAIAEISHGPYRSVLVGSQASLPPPVR